MHIMTLKPVKVPEKIPMLEARPDDDGWSTVKIYADHEETVMSGMTRKEAYIMACGFMLDDVDYEIQGDQE